MLMGSWLSLGSHACGMLSSPIGILPGVGDRPETSRRTVMSQPDSPTLNPKSVRHKQILEAAAAQPEASYEELADSIPSATGDLVENVLEKYGDPADENDDDTLPHEPLSDAITPSSVPTLEDLSEIELETLQLIHDQPDATQQELADELDLTPAAICSRVKDIPGFDWAHREDFTTLLFEPASPKAEGPQPDLDTDTSDTSSLSTDTPTSEPTDTDEESVATSMEPDSTRLHREAAQQNQPMPTPSPTDTDPTASGESASIDELAARIDSIETQLETIDSTETQSPLSDPELAHKVIHACLESDAISTEEELALLRALLDTDQ